MTDLINKKIELFKKFILNKDFVADENLNLSFVVNNYQEKYIDIKLDVNKAFGFLNTNNEYAFIKTKKDSDINMDIIEEEITSKLIDGIDVSIDDSKVNIDFRVNNYSRVVKLLKEKQKEENDKKEEKNKKIKKEFSLYKKENLSKTEYFSIVYNLKDISTIYLQKNDDLKNAIRIEAYEFYEEFFTQVDNLDSRIYLYIYLEIALYLIENNLGCFNYNNIFKYIRVTSNVDFNINRIWSKVLNNDIDVLDLKNELDIISKEINVFIPIMSLDVVNNAVRRRGYYFPENSIHTLEFEKVTKFDIPGILKYFDLENCKGYRNLVKNNLENIYCIKYLIDLGFKQKQIINILLNLNIKEVRAEYIKESFVIKKYMNNNNNKDVFKKLFYFKDCLKTIQDIEKMLDTIIGTSLSLLKKYKISDTEITYENIDSYFNFNLNIKNLEKEVIHIYNLIYEEDINLYYDEKENAQSEFFEYNLPNLDYSKPECDLYEDGEYSLSIPLNSTIIRKVGSELQICIATYVEKIKKQESIILFVKKAEKYIGCIELDEKYETLIQAKIRYNKEFNDVEQEFIYKFCLKNKIDVCTVDMKNKYNTISDYENTKVC